jgi:hypothetical protein
LDGIGFAYEKLGNKYFGSIARSVGTGFERNDLAAREDRT